MGRGKREKGEEGVRLKPEREKEEEEEEAGTLTRRHGVRGVAGERDLAAGRRVVPAARRPVGQVVGPGLAVFVDALGDGSEGLSEGLRAPLDVADDGLAVRQEVQRALVLPPAHEDELDLAWVLLVVRVVDCIIALAY